MTFQDQTKGVPQSWYWTFGDGATATEQHPQHTDTDAGVYTVCLATANLYGTSSICRHVKVELCSIYQHSHDSTRFRLVPNPAMDMVSVLYPKSNGHVTIFDMFGRTVTVTQMADGLALIDVQKISCGLYVVQLMLDDGSVHSQKLVIR